MIHHVLVYGTLRRGGSNHALLTSARFLSTLRTPGFVLYHLGAYPAACPAAEHQLITCALPGGPRYARPPGPAGGLPLLL